MAWQHRWGFLSPWCTVLRNRISYRWAEREEEVWDVRRRRLEVYLPTCRDTIEYAGMDFPRYFGEHGAQRFRIFYRKIREALALLSAVAHVDQSAWKILLQEECNVDLGEAGEEFAEKDIPADFILFVLQDSSKYADTLTDEIIQFYGVDQRENPSPDYLKALERISGMDANLRRTKQGLDLEIPVRVYYMSVHHIGAKGAVHPLRDTGTAEKKVQEEWKMYERSQKKRDAAPGCLRCTFVLKPVIAEFNDFQVNEEMVEVMKDMVVGNTHFSQLSLWLSLERNLRSDERMAKQVVGQLMSHVFGRVQHSVRDTLETHSPTVDESGTEPGPLRMGTIHLECPYHLEEFEIEAMGSAMALNRTSKKMSMRLQMLPNNPATSGHW
ncbi:uncharacterized protein IUM83_01999 [Phytophthora cinnamomi]|uniref:uncharacterized protein n=1 Tax=Phytophthora cinnamomi TaxID=4785 RepID=UPI00355A0347|nr:hypothetical protein IUM83_01999 [Phytophthora cinnamomi]